MTAVERAFLSKIGDLPSTCVFRGQGDSNWRLHSAATRRLIRFFGDDESILDQAFFSEMHWVYHRSVLLEPARNLGFGDLDGHRVPDLRLIAKLQRFGAATGFLDFSRNPLVALWYACEVKDCDGRVFFLDLDNVTRFQRVSLEEAVQSSDEVFRWIDDRSRNIFVEVSIEEKENAGAKRNGEVSLQAWPLLPEDAVSSIVIDAADKTPIRRELEKLFDFGRRSLFADVLQFSALNSASLPLPHFDDPEFSLVQGNQCYLQGDYEGAISHYSKSIELAPEEDIGYFHYVRGNAKAADGDLRGARRDYDVGLRHEERLAVDLARNSNAGANSHRLWRLHYNRGNVKAELEELNGALEDYEAAIRIGTRHSVEEASCFLNKGNTNLLLHRFCDAVRDYDDAIRAGSPYAQFNKGNVLVALGRFDEAFECYDQAIQGEDRRYGVICNRNGVAAILNRIGGDGYVVDSPRHKDASQRLIIEVSLRADPENRYTEFFNFHGAKGNDGNIGALNVRGGKGYGGKVGFVVVVKGEEWS